MFFVPVNLRPAQPLQQLGDQAMNFTAYTIGEVYNHYWNKFSRTRSPLLKAIQC